MAPSRTDATMASSPQYQAESSSPDAAVTATRELENATENGLKDQKAFERWRKTLSLITGVGLSQTEFQEELSKANRKQCELRKEQLIKNSPGVRFMMHNLVKAGCPLTKNMIECAPCDATKSGGFSKDHGILLCENGFFSKKHQEHTMIHEMVRAAALSGDCNWSREVRRGIYNFTKQHQECVKRRAILSVEANPECKSRAAAERAVNAVFESCYNDTRPFDEFY
ncbi:Mitochondrial inner membrane protease atp23 [Dissophora globulifera]|nr:Mitochondrial inner membrane protease atp23 [Dissophora globulifera]